MKRERATAYQQKRIQDLEEKIKGFEKENKSLWAENRALGEVNKANGDAITKMKEEQKQLLSTHTEALKAMNALQKQYREAILSAANLRKAYAAKMDRMLEKIRHNKALAGVLQEEKEKP